MSSFVLDGRLVGEGAPVYVIAEAGVNHDGDLKEAIGLVDAAAAAGADAVKFQTFDPHSLVSPGAPQAAYQAAHFGGSDQREMLERLRLPDAAFARVAEHARLRGITFMSTPFDEGSAALLHDLGVPAFKVGSGDLTNLPFLAALARRRLPMILSTGMAYLSDVHAAVTAVEEQGADKIALLHCVSSYPTLPEQANLRAMDGLREAYPDAVVGYSDHCLGLDVSIAAVARGAQILERHLTLDRTRKGPDHSLSLEPAELTELIGRVRVVESALGDGQKAPQPAEWDMMAVARRSIVATRELRSGEQLEESAITLKRPAGGIPPSRLREILGKTVVRPVRAGQQLDEKDLA